MPPPIQSQSGSRAALVTWTVVSSIFFVVATVLAIFSNVAANKAVQEKQTLQTKYAQVISEADLTGDVVTRLNAVKQGDPATYPGNTTLLNVALGQTDALVKKLGGTSVDDAIRKANALVANVKKDKSIKPANDSLIAVGNALLDANARQKTELKTLGDSFKEADDKFKAAAADFQTQLAAFRGDVTKEQGNTNAALTGFKTYQGETEKSVADIRAGADAEKKLADDTINQLSAKAQEDAARAKKQDDQIRALQGKLKDIRLPVDQILRQADAHVMKIAGDSIVYIDLGVGDQVTAGMSFEIYDRVLGVPKPGDAATEEQLPKGKASIEILKVNPGSSECRIVRQTPGETVVEGDICVNLVFDKNIKYGIMVYGSFDLDRNGQATPADADVIKRLVTRWGGRVVDKLNADTDFLVIGRIPEVPNPSPEELDRPEVQFQVEQKKKELAEYDELLGQAAALNIPVLNQNRFLYFTGYFEQSAR